MFSSRLSVVKGGFRPRVLQLIELLKPFECDDVIRRAHVSRSRGTPQAAAHREVAAGLPRPTPRD